MLRVSNFLIKSKIIFGVQLILLCCNASISSCAGSGSRVSSRTSSSLLNVWTTSGTERIGITDQPGSSSDIDLFAARREYEPFQIGIRAQHKLTNVSVEVSDLRGIGNQIIPSKNITLYREHYVYVDHPSSDLRGKNPSSGKGWYADGLIPLVDPASGKNPVSTQLTTAPFTVSAGRNQPIWVDIFVPNNTPPGEYRGTFTVTSDQGNQSGAINLRVWNFELPLKPTLNSLFLFYGDQTQQISEEILKHKLNPQFNASSKPDLERGLIDQQGLKSVNLGFWSGAESGHCQMKPPPSIADIKNTAASHQLDLFKYVYSADEIDKCRNLYEQMKQWGRAIHQAGYNNLVVMAPVPELYDDGTGSQRSAVDIWVVLPKMYEKSADRISEVLQKGDQIWSYNALVQDDYSPKWQIDFAPINFRIQPGFISQSLGLTGLLYWRIDLWTRDPWKNINTFFDKNDDNRPYPGDGMLVYPGEPVGVKGIVPSMRLKWLREGIEDYEYVAILKRLGQANRALEISRSVGSDWHNWTKDPHVLELARQKLGREIEKYGH